ncbi:ankyrin repeat domain-containing protein [Candidatus Babeliales bacterium]|nr:ankyrin repeat domain-containing protein [Candidatus Babeliales bacterium]MBP9843448.1 ankyrin repeat domain-containing protein [Candidatus Babeliales bacterium]
MKKFYGVLILVLVSFEMKSMDSFWPEDIVTEDRIFEYELEEEGFNLIGMNFQNFMQDELLGKNLTSERLLKALDDAKKIIVDRTKGHFIELIKESCLNNLNIDEIDDPVFNFINNYRPYNWYKKEIDSQKILCDKNIIKNFEIVQLLIELGADPTILNNIHDKCTPLHMAASCSSCDVIKLLLDAGAVINAQNYRKETPLFFAIRYNSNDVIQYLIDAGADINARDISGGTPLHYIVQNGSTDSAQLLINAGADLAIEANSGRTPLSLANFYNATDIAELLVDAGAQE